MSKNWFAVERIHICNLLSTIHKKYNVKLIGSGSLTLHLSPGSTHNTNRHKTLP